MRPQRILIALFCSALGLLTAIAYLKRPAALPPSPESTAPLPAPTPKPDQRESAGTAPFKAAEEPPKPFTWHQVESPEYKQYITNLRSIGCPEQTIRDIIVADVNKLYASREAPLKTASLDSPKQGGKVDATTAATALESRRKLREVQMEKRAVLKELLGIDMPLDLLPAAGSRSYETFETALAALPPEKRDAVQTLQENYWQQSDALKAKYKNKRAPEFLAEHRALTEGFRQEMSKALTPAELEDYNIRTSTTATRLGKQMAIFAPSEEEFRKVFRATQEFDNTTELLTEKGARDRNVPQERAAASARLDEQLKSALGEGRFAEYQRAQDANYQNLVRVGQRYALMPDTVLRAYELEKTFQAQQVPLPGSPPVDKNLLLKQWNEQLTAVLGDKAARAYRQVRSAPPPTGEP